MFVFYSMMSMAALPLGNAFACTVAFYAVISSLLFNFEKYFVMNVFELFSGIGGMHFALKGLLVYTLTAYESFLYTA